MPGIKHTIATHIGDPALSWKRQKGCCKSLGSIADRWHRMEDGCSCLEYRRPLVRCNQTNHILKTQKLQKPVSKYVVLLDFVHHFGGTCQHVHQMVSSVQSSNPGYLSQLGKLSGEVICQAHSARKFARCECRVEISLNENRENHRNHFRKNLCNQLWMSDLFAFVWIRQPETKQFRHLEGGSPPTSCPHSSPRVQSLQKKLAAESLIPPGAVLVAFLVI